MRFVIQTLATNPPGFLAGVEAGYIFHCDTELRNAQVFSDLAEAEAVAQSMDDGYGAVVESLGMIDVPLFHDRERAGLAEAKPKDRAILAAEIYSYVHEHLPERITCGYAGCLSPESPHGALRRSNRCRCDPMLVVMAHIRAAQAVDPWGRKDDRPWVVEGNQPPSHEWAKHEREGWTVCSRCGLVRNYSKESECKGTLPEVKQR